MSEFLKEKCESGMEISLGQFELVSAELRGETTYSWNLLCSRSSAICCAPKVSLLLGAPFHMIEFQLSPEAMLEEHVSS